MTYVPERPRLAPNVQARIHVAGEERKVVLLDVRTEALLEISMADWRVLCSADGTRDLDGLLLASAARGEQTTEAEIAQLVSELAEVGVLEDGLAVRAPAAPVERPPTPPDRPLEVLPDFELHCDGAGSCCRFYGSVGFFPAEALRARVVAQELELPLADEELFAPLSGAQCDPGDPLAVALHDGRCVFLAGDGLCEIHRNAGAAAKPFACQHYPLALIDDGSAIRVSLGPECACIFASVGRKGGAPLVPSEERTRSELARIQLLSVPDPVPLSPSRTATREALRAWSRRLHDALREGTIPDVAAFAWSLASHVEEHGIEEPIFPLGAETREASAEWLARLQERASAVADTQEGWRGASDLSRRVARWLADALSAHPVPLDAVDPDAEAFYLAALAWGHRVALEGRTLGHGLRDRATRILAARAMARLPGPEDTSARYPLALLEAAMRNLGIASYAHPL